MSATEVVAILLFSINVAAFITIVFVGVLEAFKFRLSFWTSRVNFELGWMVFFLVLETGMLLHLSHSFAN